MKLVCCLCLVFISLVGNSLSCSNDASCSKNKLTSTLTEADYLQTIRCHEWCIKRVINNNIKCKLFVFLSMNLSKKKERDYNKGKHKNCVLQLFNGFKCYNAKQCQLLREERSRNLF